MPFTWRGEEAILEIATDTPPPDSGSPARRQHHGAGGWKTIRRLADEGLAPKGDRKGQGSPGVCRGEYLPPVSGGAALMGGT